MFEIYFFALRTMPFSKKQRKSTGPKTVVRSLKAVRKMLVKLTPGEEGVGCLSRQFDAATQQQQLHFFVCWIQAGWSTYYRRGEFQGR